MLNELVNHGIGVVVTYGTVTLMPAMVIACMFGVALRWLIYFTVKSEYTFALEFEKRVFKHLNEGDASQDSGIPFHRLTKQILERTYHEHFELKKKYKRRRFDHVTSVTDRLFLIEVGAQRLVRDTLSQTKYLKKGGRDPKFLDISKYVFNANPVFNRLLGVFPMSTFHEIINILPGLFVIGGIFGTFLGTMQALPGLSQIDITNVEITKKFMDMFLMKISEAMGTSILGILLSVGVTMLNTIFSPEGMYVNMVNKFTSSLEFLWNESQNNDLTEADFEEQNDRRADLRDIGKNPKQRVVGKPPALGSDAQIERKSSVAFAEVPAPRRAPEKTQATAPAPVQRSAATPPPLSKQQLKRHEVETVEAPRPNPKQLEIKLKIVEKALETLEHRREKMTDAQWKSEKNRLENERHRIAQQLGKASRRAA